MKQLTAYLFSILALSFGIAMCAPAKKHNWQLNFHPATDALVILDGKVFKGSINDIDPSGVTVEYIHKEQLKGGIILVNSLGYDQGLRPSYMPNDSGNKK